MALPRLSWLFTTFLQRDTQIHYSYTTTAIEAIAISCAIHIECQEESRPVYSARQAEGEVGRAVGPIGGRHYGVASGRKTAGQTDVLGVAVRDTTGSRILVPGQRRLRFPFWILDTQ